MRSIGAPLINFVLLLCGSARRHEISRASGHSVMMISGMSSLRSMCLMENSGIVGLDVCTTGIAAGDGREQWMIQPGGQLASRTGNACLAVENGRLANGGAVVLADCEAAPVWDFQENGQFKIRGADDGAVEFCLSQGGLSPGMEDVAANAAVSASSALSLASHGAALAVDGKAASFWASEFDAIAPVIFTVDFGVSSVNSAEIDWEFPARSFVVSVSEDGERWVDHFATDSNVLEKTRINFEGVAAVRKLRITMHEAHPVRGQFQGHAVFGIRSLSVFAPRLRTVVQDCVESAKSADARDKYFLAQVGEFDDAAAKQFHSEVPSLEAAVSSLSNTLSELTDALPRIGECSPNVLAATRSRNASAPLGFGARLASGTTALDTDFEPVASLIQEARKTIMAARKALV